MFYKREEEYEDIFSSMLYDNAEGIIDTIKELEKNLLKIWNNGKEKKMCLNFELLEEISKNLYYIEKFIEINEKNLKNEDIAKIKNYVNEILKLTNGNIYVEYNRNHKNWEEFYYEKNIDMKYKLCTKKEIIEGIIVLFILIKSTIKKYEGKFIFWKEDN